MMLKKFDYTTLNNLEITPEMAQKLMEISQLIGQQSSYNSDENNTLERLAEVAKIQSTDSSNRIEGIYTSDTRLKNLVNKKTTPHNRSEEEISGYRDVLDLIHNQHQYIKINNSNILTLHKHLFSFTTSTWGGHFKDIDNEIVTQFSDGTSEIRFSPPPAIVTPELISDLCASYNQAITQNQIPSLLLTGAFIFDFVSIHPFRDGNGRLSRLLMLLTMYNCGYEVGKYISLESLIERTKPAFYESLKQSSADWHKNENSYQPFLNYFLSIVLQAYRDLSERIHPNVEKFTVDTLILKNLETELKPLKKADLLGLIPEYSQTTIERSLNKLLKESKIEKIGGGRSTKYILNWE